MWQITEALRQALGHPPVSERYGTPATGGGGHRLDDDEPLDLRGERMVAAASAVVNAAPEAPDDLRIQKLQALLMDYYSASAVFGAPSEAG